ncbi:hypothetical protein SAMN04487820_10810 [Actinopolyspora mzabensis]|uniref:Bacteriocin fulvocin C-related protein n=1 Tax=Actinopolyspora mzabensis TaxID=995066 RepID=A0A1G9BZA2_ACTMZ|nr:bacteriocin fulvocin C-related protein [Actinopolyspora mzabensis]SDK44494.1 hypothetical protein SAMN04487820_10810 [Actinopolyspora mzabensis]
MSGEQQRWILAFDGSCATCREISDAIAEACDGKLEVLPLNHPQVQYWRETKFGEQPPHSPTLLRIERTETRAWTGPTMTLPLLRRLGFRSTTRVLRSLGVLRRQANGHPLESTEPNTLGRAGFLRLGGGAALATGIVLFGKTSALAEQRCAAAQRWAETNANNLPARYDELVGYPMAYRRAIYAKSSPERKARFWSDHLKRYRTENPDLSTEQREALDEAEAIAANPVNFIPENAPTRAVENVDRKMRNAFGTDEAGRAIATLGPAERRATETAPVACECTNESEYCPDRHYCQYKSQNCSFVDKGCGSFWAYVCNGLCEYGG